MKAFGLSVKLVTVLGNYRLVAKTDVKERMKVLWSMFLECSIEDNISKISQEKLEVTEGFIARKSASLTRTIHTGSPPALRHRT
jgi:hypothetical protein